MTMMALHCQENLFSDPLRLCCKETLAGLPVRLTRRDEPGFKTAPGGGEISIVHIRNLKFKNNNYSEKF